MKVETNILLMILTMHGYIFTKTIKEKIRVNRMEGGDIYDTPTCGRYSHHLSKAVCQCFKSQQTFYKEHNDSRQCHEFKFDRAFAFPKKCKSCNASEANTITLSVKDDVHHVNVSLWNFNPHGNISEWVPLQSNILSVKGRNMTFTKREFWNGQLVKLEFEGRSGMTKKLHLKFYGNITYPLSISKNLVPTSSTTLRPDDDRRASNSNSKIDIIIGVLIFVIFFVIINMTIFLVLRWKRKKQIIISKESTQPLHTISDESDSCEVRCGHNLSIANLSPIYHSKPTDVECYFAYPCQQEKRILPNNRDEPMEKIHYQ